MAVEVSVQQMALSHDTGIGGFMERVQAMLAYSCSTILSEPGSTPHHEGRAIYAQQVVKNPAQAATVAGPQVVMGVNVVATTTYDEETKMATCAIADIDLQSQILTLWNALAGLDTPS